MNVYHLPLRLSFPFCDPYRLTLTLLKLMSIRRRIPRGLEVGSLYIRLRKL